MPTRSRALEYGVTSATKIAAMNPRLHVNRAGNLIATPVWLAGTSYATLWNPGGVALLNITIRYGECITQDQHDNWTCPRCQNYCDCIKCIRIRKACGTSSPSAPTLPTTRRVSGESRLTRARAKKRPTESTAFTETSPPAHELDITTGVDRDGPAVEDALYDFKAPSETAEMKVEGWTPADIQGAGNASYETLAFQTYLRLASDSTLLSTPTSSSALPSTPHASLQTFGSDDSAFDPLKALKSFPTANEPPTHSISPLELTSDFSSMLAYSYSPTIPQTVVDEYGITGVVPINRPIPETSPKMGMKHGALMLVDVSLAENYPLDEDRLGCALGPPSEPSHPPSTLLGDADMDAVSRFLNDEMFDEI